MHAQIQGENNFKSFIWKTDINLISSTENFPPLLQFVGGYTERIFIVNKSVDWKQN